MQTFIENIKHRLVTIGFNEEDNTFIKTNKVTQPGQAMIINGQRFEQPGIDIDLIYKVYMLGDGWISNKDDTNKKDLQWIKFEVYVGDEQQAELTEAFYENDLNRFNELTSKLFKV